MWDFNITLLWATWACIKTPDWFSRTTVHSPGSQHQLLHVPPLRKPFQLENYWSKTNLSFSCHNRFGSRSPGFTPFPNSCLLKFLSTSMWIFKWDSTLQQSQWMFNPACHQKGMAALCSPASLYHPGQAASLCTPWVLSFPHARVSLGGEYTV